MRIYQQRLNRLSADKKFFEDYNNGMKTEEGAEDNGDNNEMKEEEGEVDDGANDEDLEFEDEDNLSDEELKSDLAAQLWGQMKSKA